MLEEHLQQSVHLTACMLMRPGVDFKGSDFITHLWPVCLYYKHHCASIYQENWVNADYCSAFMYLVNLIS